jgi:hypothetical protein
MSSPPTTIQTVEYVPADYFKSAIKDAYKQGRLEATTSTSIPPNSPGNFDSSSDDDDGGDGDTDERRPTTRPINAPLFNAANPAILSVPNIPALSSDIWNPRPESNSSSSITEFINDRHARIAALVTDKVYQFVMIVAGKIDARDVSELWKGTTDRSQFVAQLIKERYQHSPLVGTKPSPPLPLPPQQSKTASSSSSPVTSSSSAAASSSDTDEDAGVVLQRIKLENPGTSGASSSTHIKQSQERALDVIIDALTHHPEKITPKVALKTLDILFPAPAPSPSVTSIESLLPRHPSDNLLWEDLPENVGQAFFSTRLYSAIRAATYVVHSVCGHPEIAEIDLLVHPKVSYVFASLVANHILRAHYARATQAIKKSVNTDVYMQDYVALCARFKNIFYTRERVLDFSDTYNPEADRQREALNRKRARDFQQSNAYFTGPPETDQKYAFLSTLR